MSQTQEYTYSSSDPDHIKDPHRHHKGHHGHTTAQLWCWGAVCIIVIAFIVLWIVSIVFWNNTSHITSHVNSMIEEMNNKNKELVDSNNLFSFSSLPRSHLSPDDPRLNYGGGTNQKRLTLCHTDIIIQKENTTYLKSSKSSSSRDNSDIYDEYIIEEDIDDNHHHNHNDYYALDVKMTIDFDIDSTQYFFNKNDNKDIKQVKRYMMVSYALTSSFTKFSTIKLVEDGLDLINKRLIRTNEIILCSNNPYLDYKPCHSDDEGNNENTMFVKNTAIATMSRLMSTKEGIRYYNKLLKQLHKKENHHNKNVNKTDDDNDNSEKEQEQEENKQQPQQDNTNKEIQHDDNENNEEEDEEDGEYDYSKSRYTQYDIQHTTDVNINKYKSIEDFTKDIRIYNLVFYRILQPHDKNINDTNDKNQRIYKENTVLMIRPNKCKN